MWGGGGWAARGGGGGPGGPRSDAVDRQAQDQRRHPAAEDQGCHDKDCQAGPLDRAGWPGWGRGVLRWLDGFLGIHGSSGGGLRRECISSRGAWGGRTPVPGGESNRCPEGSQGISVGWNQTCGG